MEIYSKRIQKYALILAMLIAFAVVLMPCECVVYAAPTPTPAVEATPHPLLDESRAVDLDTTYIAQVNSFLGLARNVALYIAAAGLAWTAFTMLFGSEKDASASKTKIKYILIAIVCLILLPYVIQFGRSLFGGAYSPTVPGATP